MTTMVMMMIKAFNRGTTGFFSPLSLLVKQILQGFETPPPKLVTGNEMNIRLFTSGMGGEMLSQLSYFPPRIWGNVINKAQGELKDDWNKETVNEIVSHFCHFKRFFLDTFTCIRSQLEVSIFGKIVTRLPNQCCQQAINHDYGSLQVEIHFSLFKSPQHGVHRCHGAQKHLSHCLPSVFRKWAGPDRT